MNITIAQPNVAVRLQRTFKFETYLGLQVQTTSGSLVIAHDQGAAKNGALSLTNPNVAPDGWFFTNATTAPPTGVPYDFFWQGELWYASASAPFVWTLEMGTETSQRKSSSAIARALMFILG